MFCVHPSSLPPPQIRSLQPAQSKPRRVRIRRRPKDTICPHGAFCSVLGRLLMKDGRERFLSSLSPLCHSRFVRLLIAFVA